MGTPELLLSYIIQQECCKESYRISIVLTFVVWASENISVTLRVNAYFSKIEKNLRFQGKPETCKRGLTPEKRTEILVFSAF